MGCYYKDEVKKEQRRGKQTIRRSKENTVLYTYTRYDSFHFALDFIDILYCIGSEIGDFSNTFYCPFCDYPLSGLFYRIINAVYRAYV